MSAILWNNTAGGDWGLSSNWSPASVPGAADDVTIGVAGPYTVTISSAEAANSLTINDAGATVAVNNSLTLGTTLNLTAGTVDLNAGGTIAGGTIAGTGLLFNGGTLSSVTYDGTLDLSPSNATLKVTNGITLTGTGGTGPGSVLLTGANSVLEFVGTQTLDNAVVSIGNATSYDFLEPTGSGATLTLGPNLTLNQTGKYARVQSLYANDEVINTGTIDAGVAGGRLNLLHGSVVNQGVIAVTGGDKLYANNAAFTNAAGGSLSLGANSTALLGSSTYNFVNQGTITLASGAALHLGGSFNQATLGAVTNSGGTVFIDGTLTNLRNVLSTGTAASLGTVALDGGGTIAGGTIVGGGVLFKGGVLSGITYDGPLDMSPGGSTLTVTNGITLTGTGGTGPGSVLLTGAGSYLRFSGSQTLDNATVSIGNATSYDFLEPTGPGSILTLGANLTLTQTGKYARIQSVYTNDTVINAGTIDAAAATGGIFDVVHGSFVNQGVIAVSGGDGFFTTGAPFTNAAGGSLSVGTGSSARIGSSGYNFANQGTITLASGAALHLGGYFSQATLGAVTNAGGTVFIDGTLGNAGSVLSTGSAANLGTVALDSTGTIIGGTIVGGGVLFKNGTLSGVTYDGTLDLSPSSSVVVVANGITLTGAGGTGPGSVALTGASSFLQFSGSETVDNAAISIGNAASYDFIQEIKQGAALTLGGNLTLTQTGRYARIQSDYTSDTIINAGTIAAGVTSGILNALVGTFVNQGIIAVSGGDSFSANSVAFVNAAGGSLSVGANSTARLGGTYNFTNQGTITLGSSAGLHLGAYFTRAMLGAVTNSGGTVFVDGTLGNTGGVLSTGSAASLGTVALDSTGTIAGGTIAGGGLLFKSGTLSGVTYDGALDLSPASSNLTVTNGITLTGAGGTGPGSVLLTGASSFLNFFGNETLDAAAVSIGNGSAYAFLRETKPGSTLTLGSSLAITQTGHYALIQSAYLNDTVVNVGTVVAGAVGGVFRMLGGYFVNQGLIDVANGDRLIFSNPVLSGTGTIDLATGAVVSFSSPVGSGEVVNFTDGTDRLNLSQPAGFVGAVQGFRSGDTIDFSGIGLAASYSYSGGILRLNNALGAQIAQVTLAAAGGSPQFTLGTDGGGGTLVGLLPATAGYTIIGTHTGGIVLRTPATQIPAYLAPGGYVTNTTAGYNGVAVFGTGAAPWTFTNYGTIEGANTAGAGVAFAGLYFQAGGSVTNFGVIAGAGAGAKAIVIYGGVGEVANYGTVSNFGNGADIKLGAGGTVTNGASGSTAALIAAAGQSAVVITGAAGTVVNFATIDGAGFGVYLGSGGNVANAAGGTISSTANGTGINLQAGGTVTNLGTIASPVAGNGNGILFGTAGGVVVNGQSGSTLGLITAYNDAISFFPGTVANPGVLTVVNYGTILSTQTNTIVGTGRTGWAINVAGSAAAVVENFGTIAGSATAGGGGAILLAGGGAVTNELGGVIDGGDAGGIASAKPVAGAVTVVNLGTIQSVGLIGPGVYASAIYLDGGGSVTNGPGAMIASADFNAVNFNNTAAPGLSVGYVNNAGTIVSTGVATGSGVNLGQGGGLLNQTTGVISAYRNGVTVNGAAGTVVNFGLIESTASNGVSVASTVAATIGNFGTIISDATRSNAVFVGAGGVVTNGASGATAALIDGLWIGVDFKTVAGTVVNFGTIESTATFGQPGTVVGGSATVHGVGVILQQGGLVINGTPGSTAALIQGYQHGVYIGGSGGVPNPGAAGTVINYGTITSTGTNAYAEPAVELTAGGTISNLGVIASVASNAIDIKGTVAATISNSGVIENFTTAHAAIYSAAGGIVTNVAGAVIASSRTAISFNDTAGTTVSFGSVANAGTIESSGVTAGNGVYFGQGGVLTNQFGGLITAYRSGVSAHNAPAAIVNYGAILSTGSGFSGVYLGAGGSVTNDAGLISGYRDGIYIAGAASVVANYGTIAGTGAAGVGVALYAGSTLTNAGTIIGQGGTAVSLSGSGNRLILDPGMVLGGYVDGGGGSNDVVELAAGGGSGYLSLALHNFAGPDLVQVDPAATWVVDGTAALGARLTVSDAGTLTFTGAVSNDGLLDIGAGAALALAAGVGGSGSIDFTGGGGLLEIGGTTMPTNTISGFSPGDTIDLRGLADVGGGSATLGAGNLLTVNEGGRTFLLQLDPVHSFAGEAFAAVADGFGGTDVVFATVVGAGQTLVVSAGQTLSNIVVLAGGTLDVDAGATVISAQIGSGGTENVLAGGLDISATVASGGFQDIAGTASGTLIVAGGSQTVEVGGLAVGTVLDDAAIETVSGTASGTVISAGDSQLIDAGGLALNTVVSSGGTQVVSAGGTASGSLVNSGGTEIVSAGGSDTGAVLNGGLQEVFGAAGGVIIESGGQQVVEAAGILNGTVIDAGGTLELAAGATVSGTIVFGSLGGDLQIDGAPPPAVTIGGFASRDTIDLRGLAFTPAVSASFAGNTLSVTSGGTVDQLTLTGIAAGTQFAVASDGAGGTAVELLNQTYDTLTGDSGTIIEFGDQPSFYYGEAFPQLGASLNQISFNLTPNSGQPVEFTVLVASVSVSGASSPVTVGAPIFQSSILTYSGSGTQAFTVDTGGLALAAGTQYAILLDGPAAAFPTGGTAGVSAYPSPSPTDPNVFFFFSNSPGTADPQTQDWTAPLFSGFNSEQMGLLLSFGGQVAPPPPPTQLYDFIFTYADGVDYYAGTVADSGGFGYKDKVGQSFASGLGQYLIVGAAGTTAEASGTVVVDDYSHGGPGAASPVPLAKVAGHPDGSNGLGSEMDAVLGTDGQAHPFSSTLEASFTTAPLFGFVFTYNDGEAFYSGTVAGSPSLPSSPLGTYSVFAEGVTAQAAGTVVVDRFTVGTAAFVPNHAGAAAVDGSGGLGSELGSVTINGQTLQFSDTLEPRLTLSVPTAPATPPPVPSDVITAELDQIYADVLGRNPDPSGLATYSALLAEGASPTEIRQIIATSAETQNDLNLLYQQVFGRDIDPSGQGTYTAFLGDGVSLATIELILAQSPEAQNDLQLLYQQVLGRSADGGGLVTYSGLLANGYGIGTVRDIVAHSPEAQNDLNQLFQGIIGRTPDAAELVGMEDLLAGGASQAGLQGALSTMGSAGGFTTVIAPGGDAGLVAVAGTPTLFSFDDIGFGNDTIAGFDPSQDALQLPPALAASFAAVQQETAAVNGGSLITLNPSHSIFLAGVAPAALTPANFTFA